MRDARRLHVRRDPDRERASATEETVIAVGAQMPSGNIVVEWNREAFDEDERATQPVTSVYCNVEDAEQATSGTVIFEDE